MKKQKEIKVCPNCESPLIWTFYNAYNEYFCLNCHYKHGMIGAGDDIPLTQELRLKEKILKAIWNELYGKGWLLPASNYKKGKCKKCDTTYHNSHLTKNEIDKNIIAKKMLEKLKHLFN